MQGVKMCGVSICAWGHCVQGGRMCRVAGCAWCPSVQSVEMRRVCIVAGLLCGCGAVWQDLQGAKQCRVSSCRVLICARCLGCRLAGMQDAQNYMMPRCAGYQAMQGSMMHMVSRCAGCQDVQCVRRAGFRGLEWLGWRMAGVQGGN